MIKQKTLIIIVTSQGSTELNVLERAINKKIDGFLEKIQEEGHTPFSVTVSSKDDVPTIHCFIATIMYRENITRKVITEKKKT